MSRLMILSTRQQQILGSMSAQDVATLQGFWVVLSASQPASIMYGVPVVWIDPTRVLDPVPAIPTPPTWQNLNTSYVIPAGVIGVEYLVGGVVQTPGTKFGVVEQTTVVTARATLGYVLPGSFVYNHSFPDPAAVTVLTSDAFTTGTTLAGRSTDATLGGTTKAYVGQDLASYVVGGGVLTHGGLSPLASAQFNLQVDNMRVAFNLNRLDTHSSLTPFTIYVGGPTGWKGFTLGLGATRWAAAYSVGGGFTTIGSAVTPVQYGAYKVELYVNTATITFPNNATFTYDLTGLLQPADRGQWVAIRSDDSAAGQIIEMDSLVVSKIGW